LSILQINVQLSIEIAKAFAVSVNIHSRFRLINKFLQEVTQITMQWHWLEINQYGFFGGDTNISAIHGPV